MWTAGASLKHRITLKLSQSVYINPYINTQAIETIQSCGQSQSSWETIRRVDSWGYT